MSETTITELTTATTVSETADYIPVVDSGDTTESAEGTTKKATVRKILGDKALPSGDIVGTSDTQTLTGKTLTSPKINEDVALTASATELNQLDDVEVGGTTSGDIATIDDTQTLTAKTLTSPVVTGGTINGGSALTVNSTELNLLDNQTVLRKQAIFGSSLGTSVAAGETKYIGTHLAAAAYTSAFLLSYAGTIKNLYVYSNGSPGVGETYTYTLMKDNVAQTVTCEIASGANQSSDTSHSFTVNAGQRVSLRIVSSASAAGTTVQFSFQFEPS